MCKEIKFYTGWVDSSIHNIINTDWELFSEFKYSLITSIDSCTDLHDLNISQKIVSDLAECELFQHQLLLNSELLLDLSKTFDLFSGFDEIWFFNKRPIATVPAELWIAGPREFTVDVSNDLKQWMELNQCGLALGDGIGLNYATFSHQLAQVIRTSK